MTSYVFPPPAPTALPIAGSSALFPVRRVFCVGRNYGDHVKEMGGDPKEQPPVFFAKPADAVIAPGGVIAYPSATQDLHHEIELVVALKSGGANIAAADALALVFGYAAGVDLTRRDLQNRAKASGQPWDSSKAFDASAPVGAITPVDRVPTLTGTIALTVNGQTRQASRLCEMIWSIPEIIAEASKLWRLEPGDLIFTGTPGGVGPLVRGDAVIGRIEGVGETRFTVA